MLISFNPSHYFEYSDFMTRFYFDLKPDFLPCFTRSFLPTPRLKFGYFFFSQTKVGILTFPPKKLMLSEKSVRKT